MGAGSHQGGACRARPAEVSALRSVAVTTDGAPARALEPTPEHYRCPDCRDRLFVVGEGTTAAVDWRCVACGRNYPVHDGVAQLIGDSSQLNVSEVATQDRVSDNYENVRYRLDWARRYHEHNLDLLLDLGEPRGAVLDLGCGNGMFLEYLLSRRSDRVERLVGLDVSPGMLEFARRKESLAGDDRVELVQGDSCRLPFADGAFDVVYARGLLHHLPDPADGAAEMGRVLRPGGVVVTLDPHRTFVSAIPRWLARKGDQFDDDHKNFSVPELRRIAAAGLEVDRLAFMGFVAYPLLGFPDVLNFGKVLPLGMMAPMLIGLDNVLARVPGVARLGWGVMLRGTKPA